MTKIYKIFLTAGIIAAFVAAWWWKPLALTVDSGVLAFRTDDLTVTNSLAMTGATLSGFPTTTCPGGQAQISTAGNGAGTCSAFSSGTGTINTVPIWTAASVLGNSTFPIINPSATALTIGDSSQFDITTINGRTNITSIDGTLDAFTVNRGPNPTTQSNTGAIHGISSGNYDTTAGILNASGVIGTCSAVRTAGAFDLRCNGVYGEASTGLDNRAIRGVSSSVVVGANNWAASLGNTSNNGTNNYGVEGFSTGNGTNNWGATFSASGATTINRALETTVGNVLLNSVSGTTRIMGTTTFDVDVLETAGTFQQSGAGGIILAGAGLSAINISGAGHIRTTGTAASFGATCACASTRCTDVGGTFTINAAQTTCVITLGTYTGADDADCLVVPIASTTLATYTTTATTINISVASSLGKYKYICIGTQ